MTKISYWSQSEAVSLCREIESVCPEHGCHVALTGGLLYKDGPRKDLDLLFYRIRQVKEVNMDGLWKALEGVGVVKDSGFGWCYKAQFQGKNIDVFFPEEQGGNYDPEEARQAGIEARAEISLDRARL